MKNKWFSKYEYYIKIQLAAPKYSQVPGRLKSRFRVVSAKFGGSFRPDFF